MGDGSYRTGSGQGGDRSPSEGAAWGPAAGAGVGAGVGGWGGGFGGGMMSPQHHHPASVSPPGSAAPVEVQAQSQNQAQGEFDLFSWT
jgi:hypothetical protein